MKVFSKLNIERYYKMTNDELEEEAGKFKIVGYFSGSILIRVKIIEQLIAKDTSIMLRYTLLATIAAITIAVISLIISLIAIFI